MIDKKTFNAVRDELFVLGAETQANGKSFKEFSKAIDDIRLRHNVPIKDMNIILEMLANWVIEAEKEAKETDA